MTLPRIRSGLVVSGTFDPNQLNEILGVDAEVRRAGEPLRGGRLWRSDTWHLKSEKVHSVQWPAQLDGVLAKIMPKADEFVAFCDQRELDRFLKLVGEMTDETPIGAFTRDQVEAIARLGCSIDLDLYAG